MKKLSRVKLQNALVLEEQEMKRIYGGSGGASGVTHQCLLKCGTGRETWFMSSNCDSSGIQLTCDYYGYGGPISCTCP